MMINQNDNILSFFVLILEHIRSAYLHTYITYRYMHTRLHDRLLFWCVVFYRVNVNPLKPYIIILIPRIDRMSFRLLSVI